MLTVRLENDVLSLVLTKDEFEKGLEAGDDGFFKFTNEDGNSIVVHKSLVQSLEFTNAEA